MYLLKRQSASTRSKIDYLKNVLVEGAMLSVSTPTPALLDEAKTGEPRHAPAVFEASTSELVFFEIADMNLRRTKLVRTASITAMSSLRMRFTPD